MAAKKSKTKRPYVKVRLVPEDSKMKDHGFYYYAIKPGKGEAAGKDAASLAIAGHRPSARVEVDPEEDVWENRIRKAGLPATSTASLILERCATLCRSYAKAARDPCAKPTRFAPTSSGSSRSARR